ncbi:hypothetical protein V492_01386 [Pseudogymnoascus sp. VKM F-4246]|nr:hypothetical protein V492_01386 [Pseudogymnoascus sp. VKM F-4246]
MPPTYEESYQAVYKACKDYIRYYGRFIERGEPPVPDEGYEEEETEMEGVVVGLTEKGMKSLQRLKREVILAEVDAARTMDFVKEMEKLLVKMEG